MLARNKVFLNSFPEGLEDADLIIIHGQILVNVEGLPELQAARPSVSINKTDVIIKEYKGQRVVTLKEIDAVHGRPEGTAKRNFDQNKKHMVEGTDYFKTSQKEFSTRR